MPKSIRLVQRREIDEESVRKLCSALSVNDFSARLLLARGFDENTAKKYLFGKLSDLTDPFAYTGMKEGAALVKEHIEKGNTIVVYGDYDCDGIGAVSILMRAFSDHGVNGKYYVPVRADEGYGLNCDAIAKIKRETDAKLIITVDCGISSISEVQYARDLGVDVLVTDHHRPGETLPNSIVVDPCLNPDLTPLCGAGVALYLVRALFGEEDAKEYLDICALSTVADLVPLVDDNRIIVKFGIGIIRYGLAKPGIKALIQCAEVMPKVLTTADIGFKIAPRINASGRLASASSAITLLCTEDTTEAMLIAQELSQQNADRQAIEKRIVEAAKNKLKDYDFSKYKIIVLYDENWEEGVNGIAAAKLTEYFYLPTILLTKSQGGLLKGSARSIPGVNIFELIDSQKELLNSFGGHTMAAGLSIKKENLDKFREGINERIIAFPQEYFIRTFQYDIPYSMFDVSFETTKILRDFEPYGFGNPTPVFLDTAPSVKFSRLKGKHLKGKTKIGDVLSFGKGVLCNAYNQAEKKSLLYTVEKNYFNGNETEQVKIREAFFERFFVDKGELLSRFCSFSLACSNEKQELFTAKKSGDTPKVDVFFNKDPFDKYCLENEDVTQVYAYNEHFVQGRVAVLSPDKDFPFSYYSKVVVHGEITSSIRQYFSPLNAEFCDADVSVELPYFSINEMRNTYVAISESFKYDRGYRFFSDVELYEFLKKNGYLYDYARFVLHFYILVDVKLLKIENNTILLTNERKVDLFTSPLYVFANGKTAD